MMVLSHFQTRPLLVGREAGERHTPTSVDLGLTRVEALIEPQGVCFPGGERISWDAIEEIDASENGCFLVKEGEPRKIQRFSDFTNQLFSLMPTRRAPTMLISGVPMHRIKGTDPHRDTLEKIKTLKPLVGVVLDTATGLGYTAIEAARTADRVVTIELDPTALEIARCNPWSRELFDNPRIEQRLGDSCELVAAFDGETFSRVIHDPPAFRLAGHLYSREFYAELYRVLRRGGRLFHYVGDPESRSGRSVTRGVLRRLQEVGFKRVLRRPRAFGVLAFK